MGLKGLFAAIYRYRLFSSFTYLATKFLSRFGICNVLNRLLKYRKFFKIPMFNGIDETNVWTELFDKRRYLNRRRSYVRLNFYGINGTIQPMNYYGHREPYLRLHLVHIISYKKRSYMFLERLVKCRSIPFNTLNYPYDVDICPKLNIKLI